MKAFVIAALLVASVASQNLDLLDLMKDKTLLKYKPYHTRSTIEDLLLKEKLAGRVFDFNTNTNKDIYDVLDLPTVFGKKVQTVYTLEELVSFPLFREYLQIPLFRQFLEQYPEVFRRYVESPLFQQFWTVPQFQQYFRNPVLFYKYIVPQVQVIAQTVVPTTEGIYNYDTVSRFNVPYGYKYNQEWSVPMTRSWNTFPFGGKDVLRTVTPTTSTYYKYLLEKMIKNLNINKVNEIVPETYTDVKLLPTGDVQERTVGKIVDPITGEEKITYGDIKIVDEKIVPVQGLDFYPVGIDAKYNFDKVFSHYNTETIKELLLKKILLNKIFGDKKVITPQVYETLFGGEYKELIPFLFKNKNILRPETLETVFGNKKVISPEVYETLFDNKKVLTPEVFQTVFGENKNILTPEVYEILVNGNKQILTPQVLEQIFGKKVYTPEVYGTLFGTPEVYKYDVDFEPLTTTFKNKMIMNPLVYRMLKNKKTVLPRMNVMTLEKIQNEKMIEELKKEKIMGDLIKNKDLYTLDAELPKMMETEKVKFNTIPLTMGKPIVGSGMEEFQKENKEIKF